ncbi:MAG TPA: PilW family protein [Tahibacter sp.]|uniref:PilW family protein n=1 Tax=Tahibacter sp. TaxID=2056211 RepID=UPI002CB63A40|nr:PilW family protein [Tahibacter sp.]HSX59411.1 PilW family protein [Tahibacter sp.]
MPIAPPRRTAGFSLIEMMVAIAIAAFLLLGITQVFSASKNNYLSQEALSRIQENARFAMIRLQRSVRMAGYLGAGNDLNRLAAGNASNFINHLAPNGVDATLFQHRFHRSIEVFDANDSNDGAEPQPGGAGSWTPALPPAIADAAPLTGSDILVVRHFSEESIPLAGFNTTNDTLIALTPTFPDGRPFVAKGIYGVGNYRFADVFQASAVNGVQLSAPYGASSNPGNTYQFDAANSPGKTWRGDREVEYGLQAGSGQRWWNAELHRAEYTVYYVGRGANGQPALMMQTLQESTGQLENRELIDGIESLQVLVGIDTSTPANDGADVYRTGAQVAAGAASDADRDARWRSARSLQIGLLLRSPAPFVSPRPTEPALTVLDRRMTRPNDGYLRQTYQTTVSLRNRVSNSM